MPSCESAIEKFVERVDEQLTIIDKNGDGRISLLELEHALTFQDVYGPFPLSMAPVESAMSTLQSAAKFAGPDPVERNKANQAISVTTNTFKEFYRHGVQQRYQQDFDQFLIEAVRQAKETSSSNAMRDGLAAFIQEFQNAQDAGRFIADMVDRDGDGRVSETDIVDWRMFQRFAGKTRYSPWVSLSFLHPRLSAVARSNVNV